MRYFRFKTIILSVAVVLSSVFINSGLINTASADTIEGTLDCSTVTGGGYQQGDKDTGYYCKSRTAAGLISSGNLKCPTGYTKEQKGTVDGTANGVKKYICINTPASTQKPTVQTSSGEELLKRSPELSESGATTQQISECITEASEMTSRTGVQGSDLTRKHQDFFVSCLAAKTGKPISDIRDALGNVDPINAISITAPEQEQERECGTEIPRVGWLLCGILDAAVGVADFSWRLLEWLLQANPLSNDPSSPYYQTWKNIRDIANILLVIFFLFVIFSQITSFGISNYGIKKILPKIIIAAIVVNVSYFLMAVVVDLSNILGKTLDDLIMGSLVIDISTYGWGNLVSDILASGLTIGSGVILLPVAGAAIGAFGGGIGPVLIFLIIALIPSVLGVIAGLFALMFRWSIIPILAIFSPVAIAAWVLPNTQPLFDRWKKMFSGMVFLYPLASLYYGALKFVAITIIQTNDSGTLMKLIAFPLLFMGSFVIVGLAIKSNSIMSGMMKVGSGFVNKLAQPLLNAGGSYAGSLAALKKAQFAAGDHNIVTGKNRFTRSFQRASNATKRFIQKRGESSAMRNLQTKAYEEMRGHAYEEAILTNPEAFGSAEGSQIAQQYRAGLDKKAVERADGTIATLSADQHFSIAKTGTYQDAAGNVIATNEYQRRAAIRRVQSTATAEQAIELSNISSPSMSPELRAELAEFTAKTSTKVPWHSGKPIGDVQAGNLDENKAMTEYIDTKISASDLATMDPAALKILFDHAEKEFNAGNIKPMDRLSHARDTLVKDTTMNTKIKESSRDILNKIP